MGTTAASALPGGEAQTAPGAAKPDASAAGPAVKLEGGLSGGMHTAAAKAKPGSTRQDVGAAAEPVTEREKAAELAAEDEAARMAADWLALLGKGPAGAAPTAAALAGAAAAVIVCSTPRYVATPASACLFIAMPWSPLPLVAFLRLAAALVALL